MNSFLNNANRHLYVVAGLALTLASLNTHARAEWPEQQITIKVPFGPGGHTDLLARLLATQLEARLGQKIVVENRADEEFNLSIVGRARPDGYTLLVTSNAALIKDSMTKIGYNPLTDFEPVAYLGAAPTVIVTRPTSGIDTLANLVARAKANPGVLSYASPGVGTSSQLAVELLKQRTKIDIRHVPFNGSGMSLMAALSGATDIAALNTMGLVRHIKAGELKALAQTGSSRWRELPDVPTMSEAGVSNAALETSIMLLAPAGTPYPIIKRLAKRTEEILEQPDIVAELLKTGFIVAYEGPEALRSRLEREAPVWHEMVDHAGLNKKSR